MECKLIQIRFIFFIFGFIINPYINKIKYKAISQDMFNVAYNISTDVLNMKEKEFKKGIWPIINKYSIKKNSLCSLKINYKKFDTIVQPINFLKNIDLFCIKYEILEGYSNCTLPENKEKFYKPFIEVTLEDLDSIKDLD